MKTLITTGALCVLLSLSAAAQDSPYAPEVKETTLIEIQDKSPWVAWDSGTLEFDVQNENQETKHVSIKFAGLGDINLRSLTVSTTGWSLDVSDYVNRLTTPVPARIRVSPSFHPSGDIEQVILELPYLTERACRTLTLHIEATGVVRNTDSETEVIAGEDRCRP